MFNIKKTKIPGCFEILPEIFKDDRGAFVKIFHQDIFALNNLESHFSEEYYSFSYKSVLRGLHFQIPPLEHTKIVYCVSGEVIDAVVDLRLNSPTYGKYELFNLSATTANIIYIPPGLAHGFYVASRDAILLYKVTTVYSPEHDAGIHWNSVGIPWPDANPTISKRDINFLTFSEFKSPFIFNKGSKDDV